MKRFSTVAMLLALFMAPVAVAQTAQEVQTEPDPSQGYLMNDFGDNWFISIDGGASVFFSPDDAKLDFTKRIAPNASLNAGKWWTPIFGTRVGVEYMSANSATVNPLANGFQADGLVDGYSDLYQQRLHGLRPHFDGMVDLINLFGGYNPNRVYSLVIYGGFGYGYGWSEGEPFCEGLWSTEIRGGLINSFHVSDAIDINIELKASKYDSGLTGEVGNQLNNFMASANVGIAYKFPESKWEAPMVPVYPTPKYTDAEGDILVEKLDKANQRISQLENEVADLNTELAKAMTELENAKARVADPAVTLYFDINRSNVRSCDRNVVKAMAEAIKNNPNQKYVVTGYADSETGTAEFNAKLRKQRAESVYNMLVKYGANPAQLQVETSEEDLSTFNYVLDRAVTIKTAK